MKKIKLPLTADLFFIFIAIFCFFYAITFKTGLNFLLCTLLSALLSLVVTTLISVILISLSNKKSLSVLQTEEKQLLLNYLTFTPREKLLDFFVKAFEKGGLSLEVFNNGIILKDKNVYIYPIFNAVDTTKQNVLDAYFKKGENSLIILSGNYESNVSTFISSVNDVTLYDINSVYETLKKYNALPSIDKANVNKRKRLILTLKGLFNKKYCKFFFISGIITLISSPLTYFKNYYIITGSILLIISAVCKFFAPATQTHTEINL